jgi:hypothetical protein
MFGLRLQAALTVTLVGFNDDRAGRMALFAHVHRGSGAQPVR